MKATRVWERDARGVRASDGVPEDEGRDGGDGVWRARGGTRGEGTFTSRGEGEAPKRAGRGNWEALRGDV